MSGRGPWQGCEEPFCLYTVPYSDCPVETRCDGRLGRIRRTEDEYGRVDTRFPQLASLADGRDPEEGCTPS